MLSLLKNKNNANILFPFFSLLFLKLPMMITLNYLPVKADMHSKKIIVQVRHISFVATQYVWLAFYNLKTTCALSFDFPKESSENYLFLEAFLLNWEQGRWILSFTCWIIDSKVRTRVCNICLSRRSESCVMKLPFLTWWSDGCVSMFSLSHKLS